MKQTPSEFQNEINDLADDGAVLLPETLRIENIPFIGVRFCVIMERKKND